RTFETVNLLLGTSNDTLTVAGTAAGVTTTVNAGLGADRINVRAISGPTTILGRGGDDLVHVTSTAPTAGAGADGIAATLTLDGGDQSTSTGDRLIFDDAGDGGLMDTFNRVSFSAPTNQGKISGFGMAGEVAFTLLEAVTVIDPQAVVSPP